MRRSLGIIQFSGLVCIVTLCAAILYFYGLSEFVPRGKCETFERLRTVEEGSGGGRPLTGLTPGQG